ncbi:ABC transporter E family member 2-like [Rutidosis leptorrhynchoides]|uniref:ABC transporter E family member 2-like n=1 Tax=Rutidosis leptorrhynchoides TaxID=125765 RepID=UPI003A98DD68
MDQKVVNLSDGELHRVALTSSLGKPADIYLIDEPSAYLSSKKHIVTSKVIKRFMLHAKKTAFVVERNIIMATYLANRVIVYKGIMQDPINFRPRINKLNPTKDRDQKLAGSYYYLDD